ncbi:MAG TPA: hypothetical protein VML95_07340 [Longimicrobiales bacterium]|nr:hypothetical protein [Longimicrobiales bacterium]
MKRATLAILLLASACGSTELTVETRVADAAGEAAPIPNLEVQLLPYDRDATFAEFEALATEPEPVIPDSIVRLQQAMASAQDEWQQAEVRWITVRDSLQTLVNRLEGMNRASGEYRVAFNAFSDLEGQEGSLRRQSEQAFARFSDLQTQVNSVAEEIRIRREEWATEAFTGVDSAIQVAVEQAGREELFDTTAATGVVSFSPATGDWWVHARHDLLFEELYWNIPVTIAGGDSVGVVLSRENAEVRPKF